jgi:glycosyltransferase involved in cell wall biosynthesis
MGNNYTMSKMLLLVGIGLTFDDNSTDDPPLTNACSATRYAVCPDFTAGSLHAYWTYLAGSMLLRMWAHIEDPNVVTRAYQAARYSGLSAEPTCQTMDGGTHPCFGDSRGGEASEGSWYQYSIFRLRTALNALHTAGYDDPTLYGPQISLENSSWWDMKWVVDAEILTSFSARNGPQVGGSTPAYSYMTSGDSFNYYRDLNDMMTEAGLMTADSYVGRTDRTNALEWLVLNMSWGGPLGNLDGCTTYCGFAQDISGDAGSALLPDLLISLPAGDPTTKLPPDPRPLLPPDLYNGSLNQHQIVRNGWNTPNFFNYYCSNSLINHEEATCGGFDVFSDSEYITKRRVVFNDYNTQMSVASQSNEMQIINSVGSGANGAWQYAATQGGQFFQGQQAELSTLYHSELPGYAADIVDSTPYYNGWYVFKTPYDTPSYNDVHAASRSLIYLRQTSQIIYYDRAATGAAAPKAVYLNTTGPPAITGNVASWVTRSTTQKVYFSTLLPLDGTITKEGLVPGSADQPWDWEPFATLRVGAEPSTSKQFLSVLEWGKSSRSKSVTRLVLSNTGQNFDGAMIGSSLVMFMRNWPGALNSTTFPASGATSIYVSDLTPGTTYSVSGAGAPTNCTTDTAGVCQFAAAGTGNITVKRGSRLAALPMASQSGERLTVKILFWPSLAGILYTYAGYPLIIWSLARFLPRPWKVAPITPSLSVVLAVHNGKALLTGKIQHLLDLDYPDIREIIIVSDGSTDGTAELLADQKYPRIHAIVLPEHKGKAVAVNAGVVNATAEVILFVDIRPEIGPGAIQQLVSNFADENVGCVSGNLKLRNQGHDPASAAVGDFYWRYEQWLRTCEAITDSPVGVYGGFYAVRRELYMQQPAGIILDDMFQPLSIIRQGFRSVVDPDAFVYDTWPKKSGDEFQRKIRTLAGNFQLLQLMPWTLTLGNRLVFKFFSHKVMRLVVPYLLVLLLVSSIMLSPGSPCFATFAALQVVTWVLAIVGLRYRIPILPILDRVAAPASALLVLNAAAVAGLYRFLFTRGPLWKIWHSGKPSEAAAAAAAGENPYRDLPRPQGLKPS